MGSGFKYRSPPATPVNWAEQKENDDKADNEEKKKEWISKERARASILREKKNNKDLRDRDGLWARHLTYTITLVNLYCKCRKTIL